MLPRAPLFAAESAKTSSSKAASADPAANGTFNVADFGAVGNGQVLCTAAVQKTIDECARAGGGKVIVPPGTYLTGPIFLKSNMNFEVQAGATLLGSTRFEDYPSIQGRWEGIDRTVFASLLTGDNLENVAITGNGTLDGAGSVWWDAHHKTQELRRQHGIEGRAPENPPDAPLRWPRPRMINLYRSKNILISDIRIQNSPSWNVHPVLCEDVCIDGLSIVNPENSPNTDGIDPDSCRNVRIANCYISTGDDCVIVKSGYAYDPTHRPSENIVVTNCVFGTGHCGVGIGSETAGGVRNVTASNCVCDGTRRGLVFKTARGRGNAVENIRANNFVMRNIVEDAIVLGMFYERGPRSAMPVNSATPTFRNFRISDITVAGAKSAGLIEGLPEMPIDGLCLSNISADAKQGVSCTNANNVICDNLIVNSDSGPALALTGLRDFELCRVGTRKPRRQEPVIALREVEGGWVHSCYAAEGTGAFVELRGPANKRIAMANNQLSGAATKIAYADGASESALEART